MLTEQERTWGELAEKATAGEWKANGIGYLPEWLVQTNVEYWVADCGIIEESAANAAFIAAARTAVPTLLARLEAEREKVRVAREALETALLYMMAPQHEQDWDAVPKVRAVLRALAASAGPEAAEKDARS